MPLDFLLFKGVSARGIPEFEFFPVLPPNLIYVGCFSLPMH